MKLTRIFACVVVVGALSAPLMGCARPGRVTGGGSIDLEPFQGRTGEKASFGFTGQQCDMDEPAKGQLTLVDNRAPGFDNGVRVHADLNRVNRCTFEGTEEEPECICGLIDEGENDYYAFEFDYRSNNSRYPGTGTGFACVQDQGEGWLTEVADFAWVHLADGPFAGYEAIGPVSGQVQPHACKDEAPPEEAVK